MTLPIKQTRRNIALIKAYMLDRAIFILRSGAIDTTDPDYAAKVAAVAAARDAGHGWAVRDKIQFERDVENARRF